MALAAAKARLEEEKGSSVSALLLAGGGDGTGTRTSASAAAGGGSCGYNAVGTPAAATAPAARREGPHELPEGYILVLTQCLPDGHGDLIFGENAVRELQEIGAVAWVRCYSSEGSNTTGEQLIAEVAETCCFTLSCSRREGLCSAVGARRLEAMWKGARARFLAPWIFGLSAHEEELLDLARRTRKSFWALTEYGRGMGNIHTYTSGLGFRIPTGWVVDNSPGGVFKTIFRTPLTKTDWRQRCADLCGVVGPRIRLWWFYSRQDDEKKHAFSVFSESAPRREAADPAVSRVTKIIPVGADGKPAHGDEKTNGEKLADQLVLAANDPSFKPTTDVSCAEVSSGIAGQLSQFIWGILYEPNYLRRPSGGKAPPEPPDADVVDIVVAPNLLTKSREAAGGKAVVAQVEQLDLVRADGSRNVRRLDGRRLFVCNERVPRAEMRTFLEQCEPCVFTTGDQSLAEAMFLDKLPALKPDAKVQQWQLALTAKIQGTLDAVPDLGAELRKLVEDGAAQDRARWQSESHSMQLEKQMCAQLGGPPDRWNATHLVLAKAGMFG